MRSGSTCWNEDTSGVGGLQGGIADFEVVQAKAIDQSLRPSDFAPGPSTQLRAERIAPCAMAHLTTMRSSRRWGTRV
jgi:hypothetical protein